MFGNNMLTGLSLAGLVILTLGTVVGIVGVATNHWLVYEVESLNHTTAFYNSTFLETTFADKLSVSCHLGLWQICCADYGDLVDCNSIFREVDVNTEALRALMVVSLALLIVSVILILLFIFREKCHANTGSKQCISLLVSLGALGFLMTVLCYVLIEYSNEIGFFSEDLVGYTGLSWSFGLAVVGALLNPIGLWMVCTQWHLTEDKEAGVKFDYEKPKGDPHAFVDTYI